MAKAATSKKAGPSTGSPSASALEQVQKLQQALLSSSDLNPLSDLLSLSKKLAKSNEDISPKERKDVAIALHRAALVLVRSLNALCGEDKVPFDKDVDQDGYILSYGARSGNQMDITTNGKAKEAQNKVSDWIRMRWNETLELLCGLLGHEVDGLRLEALQMLIELQTAASSSLTRILAAATSAKAHLKSSSGSKKGAEAEPIQNTQGLWSSSPWRALTLALIAGPPSLNKIGNGEAGTRHQVARVDSGVPDDVRGKFVQSGLEEYDDVRFATLREISLALRKPSPSIAGNSQLRAHALALLIQLTAIPTDAGDLNTFLVQELSIPPLGSGGKKKKKKAAASGKGLSVVNDGDSEEEEEEDDMAGWFSESDDEGGTRAGSTAGEKMRATDKKNIGGLGTAARAAGANKRQRKTFHQALHSLGAQRSAFSTAWTDLLLPRRQTEDSAAAAGVLKGSLVGGELSLGATHEVLVRLHAQILPHLTKPTLLHDFLVSCLDSRGATALLALNAIFTLVTKHNLDYPQFYTRLYAMLDASVLHMKYRARFLRLLETFLSSTHLSSTLVASFAKRLSRLSLRSPPAAIASVVPFVYNLLKRHPRCMVMVHKEWDGDRLNIGPAGIQDPFDAEESDPLKTHALDSSLWELASFGAAAVARGNSGGPAMGADEGSILPGEAHYLGSVTSLARILAEPFTRERYSLDDFLDITYGTLFETETKKTLNKPIVHPGEASRKRPAPALAYSLPGGFGAGGSTNSTSCNRVDIFPSDTGRIRARNSVAAAEKEEEEEMEREREERRRKLGGVGDEEDEDEREAREAIEELKRSERAKKRKVDQTGQHDVCASLFSFA
ncbi:related to NOC4 - nucleolar protein, mediates maturation and nuclear export of 40S ribosomal subunits [Melanopsichium pennsylvanicum]|uniref:Related to NOC4 - nucleolar protein, mediates maturation and nuclear export of 40S ribosomal subunits n=2 Tax=Melanopsichium pennsylvanicum TaxID=63383 RepID=A0AAJ5C4D3_9BASI|nr:cbf-domain-containing protein [Melanopsichium pennsylvanicum 4]SNX83522.1 related to NOC4 - nucleolar protein, mediates maturation and nuclear export of 40S ribosomal subunits [Melanopsichium pennsylvanicum]